MALAVIWVPSTASPAFPVRFDPLAILLIVTPVHRRYRADFAALKWFPAGSTEAQDYTGGRDLDSLVAL
jgi:hypothetical protein